MELRKVDSIGRITIPKSIREKLDIRANEEFQVKLDGKIIMVARQGGEMGQAGGGQAFKHHRLEKGTPEWFESTEIHLIHCEHCNYTTYARLYKNTQRLKCRECGSEIDFSDKRRVSVECPDCSEAYEITVLAGSKKVECRKCGRKIKVK
jgi:AbrB family looped-hinge helix DNA binding protein